jgi:hypothetical protein
MRSSRATIAAWESAPPVSVTTPAAVGGRPRPLRALALHRPPPDAIASALALLPAARAETDGLEAGLLFTARSAGLTWAQIADAMGFNSPQACQQHYNRLISRHRSGS